MNATDMANKRPIILYIIIAIALSAALVCGVWWAKNRANYYAQQTEQTGQPQAPPTPDEIASQSHEQSPGETEVTPTPVVAQAAPPLPVSVPATGAEQGVLSIFGICALIHALLSYIKARRRLFVYKTFTL